MLEYFLGPLSLIIISGLITLTYKHPKLGRKVASVMLSAVGVVVAILGIYLAGNVDGHNNDLEARRIDISPKYSPHSINMDIKGSWTLKELDSISLIIKKDQERLRANDTINWYLMFLKDSIASSITKKVDRQMTYLDGVAITLLVTFLFYLVVSYLSYMFENAKKGNGNGQNSDGPEDSDQEGP